MNRSRFWCAVLMTAVPLTNGFAQTAPALQAAEREFMRAVQSGDAPALGRLADENLSWTDAAGTTLSGAQLARGVPALSISDPSEATRVEHDYGQVAVVQTHLDREHNVRVWVQHDGRWRLLAYQEVRLLASPPTVTPGAGADCENPCRTVGMEPANAEQAGVIKAYQELEIAAENRDIELWSARIADEFIAASSNGDRLFDKPSRIAGLRQSSMRGLSPTPLVSGRIYDFADAAVMVSEHMPDHGHPLHVTRVWVKRAGQWVETLSYQTANQSVSH
jgi:Domain of unknown function (DUF4440)